MCVVIQAYRCHCRFITGPGEIMPQVKKGNLTTFVLLDKELFTTVTHSVYYFIHTDFKEPLVPPRFLERFSNRKVKQGASITLSIKVEGML